MRGIRKFAVNDKCAAGTGRFLDFMAMSMGLAIEDMVRLHFEEDRPHYQKRVQYIRGI